MFQNFTRNAAKYSFLPFINDYFGADKIEQATKTEQLADRSAVKCESGWDRIKRVFEVDDFGNVSHEANSILQTGCMSLFIGAIYGGVLQSKVAYKDFMRTNEATSFRTHLEAKAKLQNDVTMAFGKGAFRIGWRLALFSSSFVGISTLIQAYRGTYGVREYVAAGAATGVLYKFNMGPRGWLVGAGLGSTLGLICGATTLGLLSLTGLSLEEARYWQYQWKHGKNEMYRKGMADYLEKEDFAIIKLRNDAMGEEGRHIDNIDSNDSKENNLEKN